MKWTKTMTAFLIELSRRLARLPSLGYALLFLLLIPIYAGAYSLFPSHFYHSTVQYERVMHGEADDILSGLRECIATNFVKAHGKNRVTRNGLVLDKDTFFVRALKPETNGISFELQMMFTKKSGPYWELVTQPRIMVSMRENFSKLTPGEKEWTDFKLLTIDESYYNTFRAIGELAFPVQDIFPIATEQSPQGVPLLTIPRSLTTKVIGFIKGVKGHPVTIRGRFLRMLYLSAVTITTLGYGDIVPITNTTRMLVASEAVVGLVMIGLFLNALAWQKSREKNNAQQNAVADTMKHS